MNCRKEKNHKSVCDGKQNRALGFIQINRKADTAAQNRLNADKRDHSLLCAETDVEHFMMQVRTIGTHNGTMFADASPNGCDRVEHGNGCQHEHDKQFEKHRGAVAMIKPKN